MRALILANFDRPDSSSDGGAMLLQACDKNLRFFDAISVCLRDDRQQAKVSRMMRDLLQQRVFGIACGHPPATSACQDTWRLVGQRYIRLMLISDDSAIER